MQQQRRPVGVWLTVGRRLVLLLVLSFAYGALECAEARLVRNLEAPLSVSYCASALSAGCKISLALLDVDACWARGNMPSSLWRGSWYLVIVAVVADPVPA